MIKEKKKSKTGGKPIDVVIVYGSEKPTLRSVFEWGNGKYRVVDEVELEKNPKMVREKEKFYD